MSEPYRSGFVALIGRPNAGKSTLLNRLIGQKIAITSDKPQTTRNKILGVISGDNWQMVLLDTPGIHKPKDRLGESMVKLAMNTLSEVDAIYYLIDASVPFGGGDAYIISKLNSVNTPVFLILNKIDLLEKKQLLPLIDFYRHKREWQEIIPISALQGENTATLLDVTRGYLLPGPQYFPADTLTDQPERMLIAELIREKVIEATRDEVPHSLAVNVDLLEPRGNRLVYVGATIYVERDSQKGIVIGKNGRMLKAVGSKARAEIENLLGSKTFLELWVKVKSDWRNREGMLRELGYTDS